MITINESTFNVKYKVLLHDQHITFILDEIPEDMKKILTASGTSDKVVQLEYDECVIPVLISYFGSNKFYATSFE